ncbi:MAG TPA: penicillin acylase family protein [Cyclobacteriaceae bacterium]|nr:penicillin acylase family protein [Cyclobacteriaceae bacterium]
MRVFKWIGVIVALLLVAVVAFLFIFLQLQKPSYDGTVTLTGLEKEVEVQYDKFGVPHIYASGELDAYYALGYVHAQDRLFQMEMLRRAADGRLSEVLGEDLIKVDKLFRTLGINEFASQSAQQFLSADTAAWQREALAYQRGINAFIDNGPTPIEFSIIGIPKTKFEPRDIYLAVGFMSFGFAEGLRVDPVLEKIRQEFGDDYLKDFDLSSAPNAERIRNYNGDVKKQNLDNLISALSESLEKLPVPLWTGSNGWVVSSGKSQSGFPILANDTHIGFGQPAVWYEAHLEYPGFSFYGHHIAGIPFGLLGNNRHGGWGLTMFENDETDFFTEEVNPANVQEVKFMGEWESIGSRMEVIKIKGGDDLLLEVRSTRHGPIVNGIIEDVQEQASPVSLSWMLTQHPNRALEAAYLLNHSKSIEETQRAASLFTSPGLNVMYGDKDGNIAWWAVGKLPVRPTHVQSKLFLNGSSGEDEYLGYYDFSKNPQAINPPWGYVYSSNNQPDTVAGVFYPGYYYPRARAHRIVSLLEADKKFTAAELQKMQLDVVSETAPLVAKEIANVLTTLGKDNHKELISVLKNWDGDHQADDIAPTLYYNTLSFILYQSLPDEIGTTSFKSLLNSSVMKGAYLKLVSNDSSRWWDDIRTPNTTETRSVIFERAADKTLALLTSNLGSDMNKWTWKRVHSLTHGHALGAVKPLDKIFNVGPFEAPGGIEVLNNLMFTLDTLGTFPVISGPALRKVTDFGDIENGYTVSPSGQSGNLMSKHYDDQAEMFVNGSVRKMLMNAEEIRANSTGRLQLIPAEN